MESQTIREIKRNLDKPDQEFLCHLLHKEMGYIILDYTTDRPYMAGDTVISVGSRTIGHYWAGAGYVLWEMFGPEGDLLGYYVHFCRGPIIEDDRVEYTDLILDLWVAPDGIETVLDEDELRKALRLGLMTHEECGMIQRRRADVMTDWEGILAGRWRDKEWGNEGSGIPLLLDLFPTLNDFIHRHFKPVQQPGFGNFSFPPTIQ